MNKISRTTENYTLITKRGLIYIKSLFDDPEIEKGKR